MGSNLEKALEKLNKEYGKGTVMSLGDSEPISPDTLLSTGSLLIDKALGGGIARRRITEIFGPESSGKTTLALHLAAETQKKGGKVAYIDVEQALDPIYAKSLGVKVEDMIFSQPMSGEQAMSIIETLVKTGEVDLIILDSVAALSTEAELNGEMGDTNIGLTARLMSKAMRKLVGALNEFDSSIVFINQLRAKISTGWSSGPTEITTGGNALKYFASQRIEVKKTTQIKEGDVVIGQNTKITIKKNKIAPPMKVVEVPLIYGKGFNGGDEVLELAIEYGLIEKTGGWYTTHDGQRLNGMGRVREYYSSNPELSTNLREMVIEKLSGVSLPEGEVRIDPDTGEILDD